MAAPMQLQPRASSSHVVVKRPAARRPAAWAPGFTTGAAVGASTFSGTVVPLRPRRCGVSVSSSRTGAVVRRTAAPAVCSRARAHGRACRGTTEFWWPCYCLSTPSPALPLADGARQPVRARCACDPLIRERSAHVCGGACRAWCTRSSPSLCVALWLTRHSLLVAETGPGEDVGPDGERDAGRPD